MNEPDYRSLLPSLGLEDAAISQILGGVSFSVKWLHEARAQLTHALSTEWTNGVAVFALGSIGRHEASPCSDVDLGVVYVDERFDAKHEKDLWSTAVKAVGSLGLKVEEKTFNSAWPLSKFLKNIGGIADGNTELTYRTLLLTEAAWLCSPSVASEIRGRIFEQYSENTTSGKYLTSLSNDLHRYYRTVCVDYRHKVEEKGKPWAIRVLKLRHSRKLWHLGNIAAQCGALKEEDHYAALAARIGEPPLIKISTALSAINQLGCARDLFTTYNEFLSELASDEVRAELDSLDYKEKGNSPAYCRARDNARAFQVAAGRIWQSLVSDEKYRDYLERYVIL